MMPFGISGEKRKCSLISFVSLLIYNNVLVDMITMITIEIINNAAPAYFLNLECRYVKTKPNSKIR